MAVKGDIYHHKSLVFHNGVVGKKYMILLNTPSQGESYLFVKTTSQPNDKPTTPGCIQEKSLFFVPANTTFFPKNTWVQLFEIYKIAPETMAERSGIEFVDTLKMEVIDKIVDCILIAEKDNLTKAVKTILRPPMQESLNKLLEKFGRRK